MIAALGLYLIEHLATARAAVVLIEQLAAVEPSRRGWLTRLRDELEADRKAIEDAMRRLELDHDELPPASPSGWTTDRLGALRLALEARKGPTLPIVEALEAITLGVLGKHKLWVTLNAIAPDHPPLREIDFDRLRARAIEQHARLEQERLTVAVAVFGTRRRSA
jgi:hypothetical protein